MYFHKECDIKPIKGKMTQGIVHRQSDYSIVSKKSRNGDGEKGVAGMRWGVRDTISIHGDGTRLSTKLTSLTKRAEGNPKYKFTSVTKPLISEGFLKECFWELKRNKSPGIDGVTIEGYEKNLGENIKALRAKLVSWKYKPQPLKRVYIPKADGTKRGLGMPAVEDKIVQMGIAKILNAIFEVDFLEVSYGFRPKRSAKCSRQNNYA